MGLVSCSDHVKSDSSGITYTECEKIWATMTSHTPKSRINIGHPEMTKESSFKRIKSDASIKMRRGFFSLDLRFFRSASLNH